MPQILMRDGRIGLQRNRHAKSRRSLLELFQILAQQTYIDINNLIIRLYIYCFFQK